MKIYSFLVLFFIVPVHCMDGPSGHVSVRPTRQVKVNEESFRDTEGYNPLLRHMQVQAEHAELIDVVKELQLRVEELHQELPKRDDGVRTTLKQLAHDIDRFILMQPRIVNRDRGLSGYTQIISISEQQLTDLKKMWVLVNREINTTLMFQLLELYKQLKDFEADEQQQSIQSSIKDLYDPKRVNVLGVDQNLQTIGHRFIELNFGGLAQRLFTDKPSAANQLNNQGYSPFHVALQQNPINKTLAEWMINNLDLEPDQNGFTSLHYAARYCPSLVQKVLDRQKTDVNCQSHSLETPLSVAVCFGEAVKILLQQPSIAEGIDLEDNEGHTPLDKALMARNPIEEINTLIQRGAQMSPKGIQKYSTLVNAKLQTFIPLHVIFLKDLAQYLTLNSNEITQRANPANPNGPEVQSSAQKITGNKQSIDIDQRVQKEFLTLIQNKNINLNQLSKFLRQQHGKYSLEKPIKEFPTALMYAVALGNKALVQQLLENGADSVYTDDQDNSALTYAARLGRAELIDILCKRGADPNQILWVEMQDKESKLTKVPLIYFSVLFCSEEVTKKLLNNGAKTNVFNEGFSPIHIGLKYGKTRNVVALLQADADPHIRTDLGNTPLHCAACYGTDRQDFVSTAFLLQQGAITDLFVPNNDGLTPLDLACINENMKFMSQCLTFGLKNGALRFNDQAASIKHDVLVQGLTAATTRLFATPNGLLTIGVTTGSS